MEMIYNCMIILKYESKKLLKERFNDDNDDRVDEDRKACQSQWSKTVRPHQESIDSSCENVSPCVDRVEVGSRASCTTRSTFALLSKLDFGEVNGCIR